MLLGDRTWLNHACKQDPRSCRLCTVLILVAAGSAQPWRLGLVQRQSRALVALDLVVGE